MNHHQLSRATLRAFACVALIAPLALIGCADAGGGSDTDTDASASSSSSSSSSSGGDTTSSSSSSSGGETTSSSSSSSGGETSAADMLKEIQGAVDYKKCAAFTNKSKGVTVRNLTVTTARKYVSKKLDGVYAQQKGGGHHGGLFITGEVKGDVAQLKIGDVVTVTGANKGFYCAQQFDSELVNKETATELPVATTVTLDKVGDAATLQNNQMWENGLVQLENVTVVDTVGDKQDFGNVFVGKDDADKALVLTTVRDKGWSDALGTYDWDNKKWTYNIKKGDKLKIVRGIITFSFNHWRLLPTYIEK